MNRGVVIFLDELLADQNRVLEVVAAPGHEGHQNISAQSQLTVGCARTVGENLARRDSLAFLDDRFLVDAGILIRALKLDQLVNVGSHLAGHLAFMAHALHANDDALGVDRVDDPVPAAQHNRARLAGGDLFHARSDDRRLGAQQRNRLPLHVRSHQRPVGIVILEERNQTRRHRNKLLRTHIHILDFLAPLELKVARHAAVGQFRDDTPLLVHFDIRLRDDVRILFPRGKVMTIGLDFRRPLPRRQCAVHLLSLGPQHDLPHREIGVAGIDNPHFIGHHAVFHAQVRTLDKPVLIDARITGQRTNEPDIGSFRRLNGTNAPVVSRMHVANFKTGALAREPPRPQGRQPPLMRDLRERIGLIHELRQLARPEELPDGRHHRLRVHQVVRHGGRHLLVDRHLFLDRALHAHQPDAELVLQ